MNAITNNINKAKQLILAGLNPAIFSTRRIVIAPVLCLAGYLLIILGILRKR